MYTGKSNIKSFYTSKNESGVAETPAGRET
jgi:hypothetical protein